MMLHRWSLFLRAVSFPVSRSAAYRRAREAAAPASSVASANFLAPGSAARASALAAAIRQIEGTFGRGAVMRLGGTGAGAWSPAPIDVVSTGSLSLDSALGVGGLPRGRIVEIYGPESSGKTTLALHVLAQAQAAGLSACFVDAEHALDPGYARAVGVDLSSLLLSQPDSGEQALEIVDTFTRSGAVDVIVVDSVAALVPRAELEGDMGDHHMALQARLMSQAMRKITASLSRSRTLIIFLNQIRQKVGVIFGSPDTTPGGNALKFYSSVRLEIRRSGQVKKGDAVTGNLVRVKVAKNKVAPPFRIAEFEMTFGHGICRAGEAADMAVAAGAMKKSGSWYSIAHPELLVAVREALQAGGQKVPDAVADESTAPVAAVPDATAVPAPATASNSRASKKSKGAAAATAAAAAAAAAPVAAVPSSIAVAAETAATSSSLPSIAKEVALNEPFLQGRERVKAFFAEHPAVLSAAVALIKRLVKEDPTILLEGGAQGKSKAVAEGASESSATSQPAEAAESASTSN